MKYLLLLLLLIGCGSETPESKTVDTPRIDEPYDGDVITYKMYLTGSCEEHYMNFTYADYNAIFDEMFWAKEEVIPFSKTPYYREWVKVVKIPSSTTYESHPIMVFAPIIIDDCKDLTIELYFNGKLIETVISNNDDHSIIYNLDVLKNM